MPFDEDHGLVRRAVTETTRRHLRDWRSTMLPVAAVALGLTAVGWWLTRPEPRPPIETLLPTAAEVDPGPAPTTSPPAPAPAAAGAEPGAGAEADEPLAAEVVVHVAGAVVRPGLVTVDSPARVADVVAAAGGLVTGADADRINLAAPVADGERVFVPVVGQVEIPALVPEGSGGPAGATSAGGPGPPALVDLNAADQSSLETLPGVGPATAQAILAHLAQNGPFTRLEDLLEVRGIGPAKLELIRPYATVG